jgi:hypothetical protein
MDHAPIVTPRTADAILMELANLTDPVEDQGAAVDRFIRRFPDVMPSHSNYPPVDGRSLDPHEEMRWRVMNTRTHLFNAWSQPESEWRENWIMAMMAGYSWQAEQPDGLRDLLKRAFKVAYRMRRCGNPQCPAPLFLTTRRTQMYCTPSCAGLVHQAVKNQWWKDHGKEWLEKRRQTAKRSAKKSQRKGGK